jgi:hypothetical protein
MAALRRVTLTCVGAVVVAFTSALLVSGCGSTVELGQIRSAALAPYIALSRGDARGLCRAFTPAVARTLADGASRGAGCEGMVAGLFARSVPFESELRLASPDLRARVATIDGDDAEAVVNYGTLGSSVHVTLKLVKVGGAWRVGTSPSVRLVSGCVVRGAFSARCRKGARVLLFSLGTPEPASGQSGVGDETQLVAVPFSVVRAGGDELREFDAGMMVVGEAGCLACHRIGQYGNRGPGPDLTHGGSGLTERQITEALLEPSAPMPSFKNLPTAKFRAVVQFLAHLP